MRKPLNILILEDSPVDAEMMIRELSRAGYDPKWNRIETEAAFIKELVTPPDLILADFSLPHFNGLRAAKLIQERGLDIPFILVSGVIGEDAAVEAMRHGVSDYILKDRIARLGMSVERALNAKRLRDELLKARRIEAFGLLAGGVAHYFNNLMGVVIGYADISLGKLPLESPVYRHLLQIKIAGEQTAALTAKLLALSRKTILQPKDLDLNAVVSEMKNVLSVWMGLPIKISIILKPNIPLIRADPEQIKRALTNLAENAMDAMPNGGSLTLETGIADLDDAYVRMHPAATRGRNIVLSVRDTGAGVPPDVLPHLFEPFLTTKPVGKGVGLGLAVVHGIIEQSGGSIDVESKVGGGTTFNLYFPIPPEPAAPVENPS